MFALTKKRTHADINVHPPLTGIAFRQSGQYYGTCDVHRRVYKECPLCDGFHQPFGVQLDVRGVCGEHDSHSSENGDDYSKEVPLDGTERESRPKGTEDDRAIDDQGSLCGSAP